MLELDGLDALELGHKLQNVVIRPSVDSIIDQFVETLLEIDQFRHTISTKSALQRLRQTMLRYVLGLGVDFQSDAYFEARRQVGVVHQRLGVPQSHYQCAFRRFQDLLVTSIPESLRSDSQAFEAMLRFILKITALDISLAVESYCSASMSRLARSLESERGKTARLQKLSVTDRLTDLHNHGYAKFRLKDALQHAVEEDSPLCVIMADLDNFKTINDTHGHLVGDDVLRIAAARMVSAARASDEIGRYGGEEFLFILPNTDMAGACAVAERVRTRIASDEIRSGDTSLIVTLSLGVTEAQCDDTVDALIQRADAALYRAKAEGRNCIRAATP
ncbi:MAG: diguanylate cyclase [Gammaproteobacteria bacterium]|nr:diguanylate cyclase [Gammaproteobacteria bacterium]